MSEFGAVADELLLFHYGRDPMSQTGWEADIKIAIARVRYIPTADIGFSRF